ncbi:hypothetical protein B0H10DRAFT_1967678 [Mycena sp. CBHHK59/15]|nr:hypothetical protein B0H10DRAFT_1967678 [Mycena sp. CBHHK59/15]
MFILGLRAVGHTQGAKVQFDGIKADLKNMMFLWAIAKTYLSIIYHAEDVELGIRLGQLLPLENDVASPIILIKLDTRRRNLSLSHPRQVPGPRAHLPTPPSTFPPPPSPLWTACGHGASPPPKQHFECHRLPSAKAVGQPRHKVVVGIVFGVRVGLSAVCCLSVTDPFTQLSPPAFGTQHESSAAFAGILVILVLKKIAVTGNTEQCRYRLVVFSSLTLLVNA